MFDWCSFSVNWLYLLCVTLRKLSSEFFMPLNIHKQVSPLVYLNKFLHLLIISILIFTFFFLD